jgi:chromosome segregation ATPase
VIGGVIGIPVGITVAWVASRYFDRTPPSQAPAAPAEREIEQYRTLLKEATQALEESKRQRGQADRTHRAEMEEVRGRSAETEATLQQEVRRQEAQAAELQGRLRRTEADAAELTRLRAAVEELRDEARTARRRAERVEQQLAAARREFQQQLAVARREADEARAAQEDALARVEELQPASRRLAREAASEPRDSYYLPVKSTGGLGNSLYPVYRYPNGSGYYGR